MNVCYVRDGVRMWVQLVNDRTRDAASYFELVQHASLWGHVHRDRRTVDPATVLAGFRGRPGSVMAVAVESTYFEN